MKHLAAIIIITLSHGVCVPNHPIHSMRLDIDCGPHVVFKDFTLWECRKAPDNLNYLIKIGFKIKTATEEKK